MIPLQLVKKLTIKIFRQVPLPKALCISYYTTPPVPSYFLPLRKVPLEKSNLYFTVASLCILHLLKHIFVLCQISSLLYLWSKKIGNSSFSCRLCCPVLNWEPRELNTDSVFYCNFFPIIFNTQTQTGVLFFTAVGLLLVNIYSMFKCCIADGRRDF